ncbi:outer membrane beta-barrel family protein [Spirosoma oryzicola]|uniref:outer membrane beta-barrel family protein n=1 Tax=Spirosoma oryzicola TaxID=2898794 RepID=UPI001E4232B4|nr:outer membrane beta-barrel family protein [Spirosoma oryzicola]UHG94941.1 outer membrane beta-barrel protein [Spirosoma oryzicola]
MKKAYKLLFIGCVLALADINAMGQGKTRLVGLVQGQNAAVGPVSFATVAVMQATDSAFVKGGIADVDGHFSIDNLEPGSYRLNVSFVGYQKYTGQSFTISNEAEYNAGTIQLLSEVKQLTEVKVVGSKPFVEKKSDGFVVNVENSVVSSGNSVLDVLERSPGVLVSDNGKVSMQGKATMVMIDGKQVQVSGESLNSLLKSLKSDNIATIELITQPSAKYDSFAGAIINIKTKKNTRPGFNGNLNIGMTQSVYNKYTAGGSFNYKAGKLNLFGNYSYGNNRSWRQGEERSQFQNQQGPIQLLTNSKSSGQALSHTGKLGLDYFLSDKHVMGVSADGNWLRSNADQFSTTDFSHMASQVDSNLTTTGKRNARQNFLAYNFNYKGTLDTNGRSIEVNVDYGRDYFSSNSFYIGRLKYMNPDVSLYRDGLQNLPAYTTQFTTYKVDYSMPFRNGLTVEIGAKSAFVTTSNDVRYNVQRIDGGPWLNDPSRTDNFAYKENINAGYVTFRKTINKWQIQSGLRVEQTNADINSITTNTLIRRNYTNLFPNVYIERAFGEKNQLSFGFRREIDRPSYSNLNPFILFTNQYSYFQGNPYLNPAKAYVFTLTHTLNNSITTTLDYSYQQDAFYETFEQFQDTKITRHFITNLGIASGIGLNINFPVQLAKWWESSNNIYGTYGKVKDRNFLGNNLNVVSWGYYASSVHTFTLNKGYKADVSINYQGPFQYATTTQLSTFNVNLGLQKSLWNNKASLKINANDIFWTRRYGTKTLANNQNVSDLVYRDTRLVRATLTYKFGTKGLKTRQRSLGSEAELNRINH